MADVGPKTKLLGQIVYQFSLVAPFIPTYLHLITSALFPIYAGAHASLSRPSSAAKPPKKRSRRRHGEKAESSVKMEGLSPWDALLYPLFTGCMLAGLYFLLKWLKDPEMLNKILNWYLSLYGVFSISRLLSDCMATVTSFVFPSRFSEGGLVWKANDKKCVFEANGILAPMEKVKTTRLSPLPGLLSRIPLPKKANEMLWGLRQFPLKSLLAIEAHMEGVFYAKVDPGPQGLSSLLVAVTSVLYFNIVDKPWWLTNLMGFSFSYGALQMMSPTTFWTGTMVLTSLFFYDIYFVFFTPIMIHVATKLDIPVKLLFPRPPGPGDEGKQALSMLGLGDVVLPGIMIGLALRFDLYLHYLKQQRRRESAKNDGESSRQAQIPEAAKAVNTTVVQPLVYDDAGLGMAEYKSAKGAWGERYWLGKGSHRSLEGGVFDKTYFHASLVGYVVGMLCTVGVMHVFKHGQPALLYLVPGVLTSLWGTAFVQGDLQTMWNYTEAEDEVPKKKEKTKGSTKTDGKPDEKEDEEKWEQPGNVSAESLEKAKETLPETASSDGSAVFVNFPTEAKTDPTKYPLPPSSSSDSDNDATPSVDSPRRFDRTFFSFSISRPPLPSDTGKHRPNKTIELAPAKEDSLKLVAEGPVGGGGETDESSESDDDGGKPTARGFEDGERGEEPLGKRRRVT